MKNVCRRLVLCVGIAFLVFSVRASEIEDVRQGAKGRSATPNTSDDDDYGKVIGSSLEIDIPPPPPSANHAGAGVQVLFMSNPYRDGDTSALVLPMFTYVGKRFFVVSPRAGWNVLRSPKGSVNLIADYRLKGRPFEPEGFLEGMEDRKSTAMAGLDGGIRTHGRCRLDLSAMTDILGRHNGQEASLALSRISPWKHWTLIPGAALTWHSADYNDYYYGVRSSEATGARPAYDPGDSLEWSARMLFRYNLTPRWSLAGAVRFSILSSEVRDSPIVEDRNLTTALFGLNYFF